MAKDSSSNVSIATHPDLRPLDAKTIAWATKERRINRGTLELLRVGSGTVRVPELNGYRDIIAFLYPKKSWKARALGEKGFVSKTGHEATFWGLEEVLEGPKNVVYVVEGEMDRCSLVEAGFSPDEVLAAPGATPKKKKPGDEEGDEPTYIAAALESGLSEVKTFVLCMDNDEAGLPFRKMMARALGMARCEFVDWPDANCKDANDYLIKHGGDQLSLYISKNRKEWPIEGLFNIRSLPNARTLRQWDPQMGNDQEGTYWAPKLYLAPSTLSVVTGQPGHGKTQLWAQIWFNIAKKYDLKLAVATFETRPKPEYMRMLRQFYLKRKLTPENCTEKEIDEADSWIADHYYFIIHPEERPTLQWVMETADHAVRKLGVKVIQIDPWNRLEGQRDRGEAETDYILRCLRSVSCFAKESDIHFQILAHPAKGDYVQRSRCPDLEDISGSKHWDNVCDQGFAVWRPRLFDDDGKRLTYAEMHHKKARYRELGYPTKFGLDYKTELERFEIATLEQPKQKPKKD